MKHTPLRVAPPPPLEVGSRPDSVGDLARLVSDGIEEEEPGSGEPLPPFSPALLAAGLSELLSDTREGREGKTDELLSPEARAQLPHPT